MLNSNYSQFTILLLFLSKFTVSAFLVKRWTVSPERCYRVVIRLMLVFIVNLIVPSTVRIGENGGFRLFRVLDECLT